MAEKLQYVAALDSKLCPAPAPSNGAVSATFKSGGALAINIAKDLSIKTGKVGRCRTEQRHLARTAGERPLTSLRVVHARESTDCSFPTTGTWWTKQLVHAKDQR